MYKNLVGISLAAAFAGGLTGSASAQLVTHKDLTTAIAMTMAETAIQTCKAQGYNVSANVVGRTGQVLVAMRGDNTGPHTLENSMKKAYGQCAAAVIGRIRQGRPGKSSWRSVAHQSCPGAGRAADQGRRGHDRGDRGVRRAGRRQGRGLRQGRHRQGRGRSEVSQARLRKNRDAAPDRKSVV